MVPAYLRDASTGRLDYARRRRIRASLQHYNSLIDKRGYCHLEITCHLGIDCTDAFRFTAGTTPKERIQTFMRQGKGYLNKAMIHIFTLINIELFCRYLSVSGVRVRGPGRFCRSVKESLNGPVQANRSDDTKSGIGTERKKYTWV